jgi:hypothetical protein
VGSNPTSGAFLFVGFCLLTGLELFRGSIVVSIPACHAGDPGSIPGSGVLFFSWFLTHTQNEHTTHTHTDAAPRALSSKIFLHRWPGPSEGARTPPDYTHISPTYLHRERRWCNG